MLTYAPGTDIFEGGLGAGGTGAGGTQTVITGVAGHQGIVEYATGTTTTGVRGLYQLTAEQIVVGSGKIRFGAIIKIPTLSDGTQTFTARFGLNDVAAGTGGDGTDSIMFRYTHSVNGGEWQGVTRSNSTESTLDTNVVADTNWHTFEFEVNADGTSVEFFIDGASVGTISTNIPTGTSRTTSLNPAQIHKSAGGTARTIQLDAYWYQFDFTTAR